MEQRLVRTSERGTATMEFVLALPFLFVVLVLTVDFASALLAKQRALVSVRELAMRHAMGATARVAREWDADLQAIQRTVEADTLSYRDPDVGPRWRVHQDSVGALFSDFRLDSATQDLGHTAGGFLNAASGTRRYELESRYRVHFGTVVAPSGPGRVALAVGGSPWTFCEYPGGYGGAVLGMLGSFGEKVRGATWQPGGCGGR